MSDFFIQIPIPNGSNTVKSNVLSIDAIVFTEGDNILMLVDVYPWLSKYEVNVNSYTAKAYLFSGDNVKIGDFNTTIEPAPNKNVLRLTSVYTAGAAIAAGQYGEIPETANYFVIIHLFQSGVKFCQVTPQQVYIKRFHPMPMGGLQSYTLSIYPGKSQLMQLFKPDGTPYVIAAGTVIESQGVNRFREKFADILCTVQDAAMGKIILTMPDTQAIRDHKDDLAFYDIVMIEPGNVRKYLGMSFLKVGYSPTLETDPITEHTWVEQFRVIVSG